MALPFSAISTSFTTTVRGRTYFGDRAGDAIAFHAMLDEDIRVESFCHHCASPLRAEVKSGAVQVEPKGGARLPRPAADPVVDGHRHDLFQQMVFFASAEHRDASDLCAPEDPAASLTPEQVDHLSGPIHARRFALDHARRRTLSARPLRRHGPDGPILEALTMTPAPP